MLDVVTPTFIITVLVLLNGLFVAAEFSIVGAPRPAIAKLAEDGNRRARLVAAILDDAGKQDRFIATAQLGITLASIALGMYGEHLLAERLAQLFDDLGAARWIAAHTLGSIIAISILTYFHIVIGEMVPKSLALQRAERMVLWIAPVMRVVQFIAYPLVLALNGIGNGLLRLVGLRRDAHSAEHYRTAEELAYLVHEAKAGGLLRSEAAKVVAELIDFSALTAANVMVPRVRVVGIPLGASTSALLKTLRERPHSRYPVYERSIDRVVGMVHVKDLLRHVRTDTSLAAEHVRQVPFVPEAAPVDQVIAAMRQARAQMAVVLDEHGGTAGIVTSEDLFEQVVGEVGADHSGVRDIRFEAGGSVLVTGMARLEALGEALGVELAHDDVDTVNGLVLTLLGRPPVSGETITYGGIAIEVCSVARHSVGEARASRLLRSSSVQSRS